ncbi:MAG: GNAT family N-acetyltransferase [Candidatus Neomarinimicrobiota bacterium]
MQNNIELIFRKAKEGDIPTIVKMLGDDELGSKREDYKVPLPKSYYYAFQNILQDKNQELIILENFNKEIIGTLQLTFISYLTYRGGLRAQIEAVRIHKEFRGKGFGKKIFKWAIKRSKDKGAHLVQLTTDKQRPDAIEFYKALGFRDSHIGMKLHL